MIASATAAWRRTDAGLEKEGELLCKIVQDALRQGYI